MKRRTAQEHDAQTAREQAARHREELLAELRAQEAARRAAPEPAPSDATAEPAAEPTGPEPSDASAGDPESSPTSSS